MAVAGKSVVLEDEEGRVGGVGGKRGLLPGGKGAVYNDDGNCAFCCACEPKVLAWYTTNANTNPVWNLRPYQGIRKAPPNSYWRIIEMGACLLYHQGCVDKQGRLVGLPDEFRSNYYYDGYMELQIGCYDPKDGLIHWPGHCQPTSWRYSC